MNSKLTRDDLYSLEQYEEVRPQMRREVMAHKRDRKLPVGPNATFYFEDRLTMHYQIQEMMRAERIFKPDEIQEELATYNPLIPDGTNWKATFMLEYPDENVRRRELARLVGIEGAIWMQVDGHEVIRPYADEDLERSTEDKTSTVHFLRFELNDAMRRDVKAGAAIHAGVDHANYHHSASPVPDAVARSLAADLAG